MFNWPKRLADQGMKLAYILLKVRADTLTTKLLMENAHRLNNV